MRASKHVDHCQRACRYTSDVGAVEIGYHTAGGWQQL